MPASWIATALSPLRKPNAASDPRGELDYGYLFWGRSYATACGRARGWYMSGNHLVMLGDLDAVAVVTTVNYDTRGMHAQTQRLLEEQLLPRLPCPLSPRVAPPRGP